MSALMDKYGMVLVASSDRQARLIIRDLRQDHLLWDCPLDFGEVEKVGKCYVDWADERMKNGLQ